MAAEFAFDVDGPFNDGNAKKFENGFTCGRGKLVNSEREDRDVKLRDPMSGWPCLLELKQRKFKQVESTEEDVRWMFRRDRMNQVLLSRGNIYKM